MLEPEGCLNLLLADGETRRPVLAGGLPRKAAERAPKPKKSARREPSPTLERLGADPNLLPVQRWGVIAPEGPLGDRILEAIAPLVRLREEEQGAPATVYRVPAAMDAVAAAKWISSVHRSEDVDDHERPRYLLLLGDPRHVSIELQHALAARSFVGRLHFTRAIIGDRMDDADEPDLDGYMAYVEKVVRFARAPRPEPEPDLLFFVAPDDSPETRLGEALLILPSLEAATRRLDPKLTQGRLPAASARTIEASTVCALLAAGAGARPSVLLSLSHGLGCKTEGARRRRQGALLLDCGSSEILDAERMLGERFLPGGMWFCVACFGAGTPATSAYRAWLEQLAAKGEYGTPSNEVLAYLPAPGGPPFIAALPQAALRNPEGPLAVIGHLDLAWTYAFSGGRHRLESRKSRIFSALEEMVCGSRAGVALEVLMAAYRDTNDELLAGYQLEKDAELDEAPDPTDYVARGHLWMLRNDLRGYVLLGDPAARLPLAAK